MPKTKTKTHPIKLDKEKSGVRIIIVGGGFGGITTALELAKKNLSNVAITLISDKADFEYKPSLYRLVSDRHAPGVAVRLKDIFAEKNIRIAIDRVKKLDIKNKKIIGQKKYSFDYLVLAIGSETNFFDIPGLPKRAYPFKSHADALKLKARLQKILSAKKRENIVIVGGGPTGVELAGEIAYFARKNESVGIELVERHARLLPHLSKNVSRLATRRLEKLGVKILTRRTVVRENAGNIIFRDFGVKTKTVVWTAGTKNNPFFAKAKLRHGKSRQVTVDNFLQASKSKNIFVIGDSADTDDVGTAQSAIAHGRLTAENICRKIAGGKLLTRMRHPVAYIIPIGPRWAIACLGKKAFAGKTGYALRKLADLRFFWRILPKTRFFRLLLAHLGL
ncbi:FAD-dependent oxidoreductase [Candidatus Microgenomates bacterium]|nr:FAD-dependent oxidoreductase [Candidatus Microgenomates bacterium]